MFVHSFEEAEWLSLEAGLEAVSCSHLVYVLELRLYGGRSLDYIATIDMRWCRRRASLICGHLHSSKTRSSRQANRAYVLLAQPSSRSLISRYQLNRPARIFNILSFRAMSICMSKPQFVYLQSKWDVLGWYMSSTKHSPPWGGSL